MNRVKGIAVTTIVLLLAGLPPTPLTVDAADVDCGDFPNQAAAQAHLRANPSDPDRLDQDRDGIACETRPCPCDRVPVNRNAAPSPQPAPAPLPIAAPAPAPASAANQAAVAPAGWARVTNIVDGDTVDVTASDGHAYRVRMFGTNTPEVNQACFGESTDALRRLLTDNGRDYAVLLEHGPRLLDQYDRTLAYLWVLDAPDSWYLLDEYMVNYGYARAWTRDGQYVPQIVAAEQRSQSGRTGCLWR